MDSDKVIHHLRVRNIISRKDEDELLQKSSKVKRAHQLLNHISKSEKDCLLQFRIALIKSENTDLVKYLRENKKEQNAVTDNEILTSYDGKCMLHLQYDCYVVAKEYQGEIYIHIRNYQQIGNGKYPTKKGVTLTLSRWLLMEKKKDEINELFLAGLDGKLTSDEEKFHLGGGVYLTIGKQFPTVDIRHFWKPDDSNITVDTKRGIALNKSMWERLYDVMELIRDFVPELDGSVICYETHRNELEVAACKECSPFEQNQEHFQEIYPDDKERNFHIMSEGWMP